MRPVLFVVAAVVVVVFILGFLAREYAVEVAVGGDGFLLGLLRLGFVAAVLVKSVEEVAEGKV